MLYILKKMVLNLLEYRREYRFVFFVKNILIYYELFIYRYYRREFEYVYIFILWDFE